MFLDFKHKVWRRLAEKLIGFFCLYRSTIIPIPRCSEVSWLSRPASSSYDLHYGLWQCWYHTAVQPHQHTLRAVWWGPGQRQQHSSALWAFTHQSSRRWCFYDMILILYDMTYDMTSTSRNAKFKTSLDPSNQTHSPNSCFLPLHLSSQLSQITLTCPALFSVMELDSCPACPCPRLEAMRTCHCCYTCGIAALKQEP